MQDNVETMPEVGEYVSDWYGHYSTSYALQVARDLGWTPADADVVDALTLTYQSTGHLGISVDQANRARDRARLPLLDPDKDADEQGADGLDVGTYLGECLDDAESWLTEHRAPEGHYWGSFEGGGWGLYPFEDENY